MPRNYTIDYIRLLAAFGVISIHLSPSSLIAQQQTQYFEISAVPFFLITSVYLFQSGGARFGKIGLARILIPYISWSAIYLVAMTIKDLATGTSINYDWLSVLFFGGAGVQLYFLPLLLGILVTASAVNTLFVVGGKPAPLENRDCHITNKLLALFAIGFLIILSDLVRWSNYSGFSGDFFNKALYYTLFSQAIVTLLPQLIKFKQIVLFCSFASILFLGWLSIEKGVHSNFISVLLAASILIVCLMQPTYAVPKPVSNILSTTYGIYLCHHLAIESIEFALNQLSIDYRPYSSLSKLIFSAIVLVLSIIFTLFIRKSKTLSLLLLGETKSRKIKEIGG